MRYDYGPTRPFTTSDVLNKDLVCQMLRYEDSLMLGSFGERLFADKTFDHGGSLETYRVFHRTTLSAFGFSTSPDDVEMYRTIFGTYYRGPQDYDRDVLGAVCYMRENKCVYYTAPPLVIGEAAPDVPLLTTTGGKTNLNAILETLPHKHVLIGAFSNS